MFDVIVPTYNRPGDINKFVQQMNLMHADNYKVIVIDDCGEKSPEKYIPANDPRYTFKRLAENKGQAFARNTAIGMGANPVVISLDDDAWFESPDAFQQIEQYFRDYPDAGCIMFNIKTPDRKYLKEEKNLSDGQSIGGHITCGCAYRREVLERVDGFGGFLHSGAEEVDLTLKIVRAGYTIRFAEKIPVMHNYLPGERSNNWYYKVRYNTCRNDLLIVWMRYPAMYILPFFFGKFLGHFVYVLRNKRKPLNTGAWVIGAFFGAVSKIPLALKNRSALSNKQFKQWYPIRW